MGTEYRPGMPPREVVETHQRGDGVWATNDLHYIRFSFGITAGRNEPCWSVQPHRLGSTRVSDSGYLVVATDTLEVGKHPITNDGVLVDCLILEAATYRWTGERIPPEYIEAHQRLHGGRWTLSPRTGHPKDNPAEYDLYTSGLDAWAFYIRGERGVHLHSWDWHAPNRATASGKHPVLEDGTSVDWRVLDEEVERNRQGRTPFGLRCMLSIPSTEPDSTLVGGVRRLFQASITSQPVRFVTIDSYYESVVSAAGFRTILPINPYSPFPTDQQVWVWATYGSGQWDGQWTNGGNRVEQSRSLRMQGGAMQSQTDWTSELVGSWSSFTNPLNARSEEFQRSVWRPKGGTWADVERLVVEHQEDWLAYRFGQIPTIKWQAIQHTGPTEHQQLLDEATRQVCQAFLVPDLAPDQPAGATSEPDAPRWTLLELDGAEDPQVTILAWRAQQARNRELDEQRKVREAELRAAERARRAAPKPVPPKPPAFAYQDASVVVDAHSMAWEAMAKLVNPRC